MAARRGAGLLAVTRRARGLIEHGAKSVFDGFLLLEFLLAFEELGEVIGGEVGQRAAERRSSRGREGDSGDTVDRCFSRQRHVEVRAAERNGVE